MNAESYAGKALRGKVGAVHPYIRSFLRIITALIAPPKLARIKKAISTNVSVRPIINANPGGVFKYSKAFWTSGSELRAADCAMASSNAVRNYPPL